MIEVVTDRTGVAFAVHVQPRASRQDVLGEHNAALKVAVGAPPEGGKANRALIELLAKWLHVPKSAVTVMTGHASRNKRVHVACEAPDPIVAKLQRAQGQKH